MGYEGARYGESGKFAVFGSRRSKKEDRHRIAFARVDIQGRVKKFLIENLEFFRNLYKIVF